MGDVPFLETEIYLIYPRYLIRGIGAFRRFIAIFYTNDNFWVAGFLFAFCAHQFPLERVYSKRKEFAPHGSKFFPLRVDLFFRREAKKKCVSSLEIE